MHTPSSGGVSWDPACTTGLLAGVSRTVPVPHFEALLLTSGAAYLWWPFQFLLVALLGPPSGGGSAGVPEPQGSKPYVFPRHQLRSRGWRDAVGRRHALSSLRLAF